jgi:glycosyltransferase involved in cell wall biosynthesis
MKIIHVREVSNVAQMLVNGLCELGHQVILKKMYENPDPSIYRKVLDMPRRVLNVMRLNKYISSNEFEIVHFHYANSGWIGALGGYPYFLHCHGSDVREDLYQPIRKWLVLFSLRRAEVVFFSTPDLYQHLSQIRPDAVFIPNPIDDEAFHPLGQAKHEKVRILINQVLKSSKAPDIAFSAAKELNDRFGDRIDIYAFAYGPELGRFQQYEDINFVDLIPYNQMPRFLNQFDIIIGQFGIGSLGMSELESMACEKPVVCWLDTALYSKWYSQSPPVLSASTPDAVIEAVANLIRDPSFREDIGRKSRIWIKQYHNYLKSASLVLEKYDIVSPH